MPVATPNLSDVFGAAAGRFPDRVAVRAGTESLSYAQLDSAATHFAGRLAALGVAGGRVGLLLPNEAGFPGAFHGLLRAGAGAVLLNPLYSPRETAEYLRDAGANAAVTTPALAPLLPASTRTVLLDPLAETHAGPPNSGPAAPEAVVIYTSAMNGFAQGARLSHGNLVANLWSTAEALRLTPDDRVIAALPLIHSFGLTVTMNAPLAVGASIIPVERFNAVRMLDLVETEAATIFCGVPAMYLGLLAAAERRGVPEHALRLAICGGAPLPRGVAERWERVFGLPLREGYGLTEGAPVCLFNRVDRPNRPGTMGYPFPGVAVSIRDDAGEPVNAGEAGELCVAGANVFGGYIGYDGRNPRDFWGEFFRTGDLVSAEPDGAIRFRGLRKAMFTRNGFNIYPREIERVLEEDPRVRRAQVSAVPDAAKENEVALVVQMTPGTALSEEDVRLLCRERLAAFKQPGSITIQN